MEDPETRLVNPNERSSSSRDEPAEVTGRVSGCRRVLVVLLVLMAVAAAEVSFSSLMTSLSIADTFKLCGVADWHVTLFVGE